MTDAAEDVLQKAPLLGNQFCTGSDLRCQSTETGAMPAASSYPERMPSMEDDLLGDLRALDDLETGGQPDEQYIEEDEV